MGHQSASDLCQSGSYGLRVGGTATTAERYNIQHNSRTPDWPGLWLSCSVPDECLGSAKRDGNGPRIPGAYVGYDNLSRADDACNPGFKSRTARRPGDHPTRLNGSDANSTGCRSHRCRDLVDCGCGRTRAKVSSQVHRHSANVFLTSEVNGLRTIPPHQQGSASLLYLLPSASNDTVDAVLNLLISRQFQDRPNPVVGLWRPPLSASALAMRAASRKVISAFHLISYK